MPIVRAPKWIQLRWSLRCSHERFPFATGPATRYLQLSKVGQEGSLLGRGERAVPVDTVGTDNPEARPSRQRPVLLGEEGSVMLKDVLECLRAVVDEVRGRLPDPALPWQWPQARVNTAVPCCSSGSRFGSGSGSGVVPASIALASRSMRRDENLVFWKAARSSRKLCGGRVVISAWSMSAPSA